MRSNVTNIVLCVALFASLIGLPIWICAILLACAFGLTARDTWQTVKRYRKPKQ